MLVGGKTRIEWWGDSGSGRERLTSRTRSNFSGVQEVVEAFDERTVTASALNSYEIVRRGVSALAGRWPPRRMENGNW